MEKRSCLNELSIVVCLMALMYIPFVFFEVEFPSRMQYVKTYNIKKMQLPTPASHICFHKGCMMLRKHFRTKRKHLRF